MNKTFYLFTVLTLLLFNRCDDDWLEVKRDKSLIVPTTLKDMRLLMTNELLIRSDFIGFSKMSADEYYLTTERWNTLTDAVQDTYLWKDDIYGLRSVIEDWDNSYNQVLTANVVLEGLTKIQRNSANQEEWDDVKGNALHLRARAFYNIAQTFAKPFDAATSTTDLGIPLRLSSDVNTPTFRATVLETYDQIINDLTESIQLLKITPQFKTDASKPAAYGMLARCYLSMREYEKALINADLCLQLYDKLMDYNSLLPSSNTPFPRFNDEVIQHTQIDPLWSIFIPSQPNLIYPELYDSYDPNDLRKVLFFRSLGNDDYSFKGSYTRGSAPFNGIATDEILLTRAECLARKGETNAAMNDLNTLLFTRFVTGSFIPYTATNSDEALEIILNERKKQLIGRGLRWTDLRRLNKEPDHAITISRTIDGTEYLLEPNSAEYVLPIPEYVISVSNIQQNIR